MCNDFGKFEMRRALPASVRQACLRPPPAARALCTYIFIWTDSLCTCKVHRFRGIRIPHLLGLLLPRLLRLLLGLVLVMLALMMAVLRVLGHGWRKA